MKFTHDDIQKLYKEQAARHGQGGTSTIQDIRTRDLELRALSKYLKDGDRVLEVGCGNGYVGEMLVRQFDIELDAFDFCEAMVDIAKNRNLSGARGRVQYAWGDVLEFETAGHYDTVFSERCIQNLVSWDDQKKALSNIASWLKPGGSYVMLESFWTGLNNLNEARSELGLDPITESWHNLFFVEDDVIEEMKALGCDCVGQDPFLSGYYFGSRVLLPALLPDPKKATSASRLNDFFAAYPAAGDFCPMKIMHFVKRP